jgi:hypothetical protein
MDALSKGMTPRQSSMEWGHARFHYAAHMYTIISKKVFSSGSLHFLFSDLFDSE